MALGLVKLIGNDEVSHRRERHFSHGSKFIGRARSLFGFLLVAASLVFAFCYREDLQDLLVSKLYQWSQAELKNGTLRQSALNHESEVNQVLQ